MLCNIDIVFLYMAARSRFEITVSLILHPLISSVACNSLYMLIPYSFFKILR